MSLIEIISQDTRVIATTLSDHFAMHPAIMRDDKTGELHLDTAVWTLVHRRSGQAVATIHQEDRHTFPGEDLAIDEDKVIKFVTWLESIVDCTGPAAPDWTALTPEQMKVVSLWHDNCNDFTAPAAGGEL